MHARGSLVLISLVFLLMGMSACGSESKESSLLTSPAATGEDVIPPNPKPSQPGNKVALVINYMDTDVLDGDTYLPVITFDLEGFGEGELILKAYSGIGVDDVPFMRTLGDTGIGVTGGNVDLTTLDSNALNAGEQVTSITYTHAEGAELTHTFDTALTYVRFATHSATYMHEGSGYPDGIQNFTDIAVDDEGNLFVARASNVLVDKIELFSSDSTYTGSFGDSPVDEAWPFLMVSGLHFHNGTLYVTDGYTNERLQIFPTDAGTPTFTGAISLNLGSSPFDITVDANGRLYVALVGGQVNVYDNSHPPTLLGSVSIGGIPIGLVVVEDVLHVTSDTHFVEAWAEYQCTTFTMKAESNGGVKSQWGKGKGLSDASFTRLAADSHHRIYVLDGEASQIHALTYDTDSNVYRHLTSIGTGNVIGTGEAANYSFEPVGLAVMNDKLYVVDDHSHRILRYDLLPPE